MSRADEALMDRLADLVADGATVTSAGRRIGVSAVKADVLWMRIKARLGEQAR